MISGNGDGIQIMGAADDVQIMGPATGMTPAPPNYVYDHVRGMSTAEKVGAVSVVLLIAGAVVYSMKK